MVNKDFQHYQKQANKTSGGPNAPYEIRLATAALGLAGEAGEVADLVKKYLGHGHSIDREKIMEELGDLLWYIAEMCNTLDLSLWEVARRNLNKLARRYPDGFSSERSLNRRD